MAVDTLTFGCRLNAYESEVMKAEALKAGLSEALIVNTCAVTEEAVRQAKQAIRKARREHPGRQIIVTGCAAQTEARGFADMDEVDLVIGNADKMKAAAYEPMAFGVKLNDKVQVNDIMVVRELTGGIYFGEKRRTPDSASDLCTYTVEEIERVTRVAGKLARGRRKSIVSVDKANVLETSRLWRSTVERVLREEFADVKLEHMLVDSAAMHLIRKPASFDVILTENMFGDILTDEASMLAGSLGLLPSASLGASRVGLYEPIHGSAPDIAGKGIANPLGTILSVAMLLRHSLDLPAEAQVVEKAASEAVAAGLRTADIAAGGPALSTRQAGDEVVKRILQ